MSELKKLSDIVPGEYAIIQSIEITGNMRRRFMDIGLIENTQIKCLNKSPFGDPCSYMIRGAVIAIRRGDAKKIRVKPLSTTKKIALIGNPNVGKSTVFNALTGLKQHTGNWAGKTVTNATGTFRSQKHTYEITDLPGTYSLIPHSAEEQITRDYLCNNTPDLAIIVCDATCLERNLNLVLQTMELISNVIVCINLIDEAMRNNIHIDVKSFCNHLGVPVVCTDARSEKGIDKLIECVDSITDNAITPCPFLITYPDDIEQMITKITESTSVFPANKTNPRRFAIMKLCENDTDNHYKDSIVTTLISESEKICNKCISKNTEAKSLKDHRIDNILTGKYTGIPIMFLLFALVFWITITGANYPSEMLAVLFGHVSDFLSGTLIRIHCPLIVHDAFIYGVFRVLTWVVSVMLPPMAIFFPFFTFLEDIGYLPRIAFILDRPFKCCRACGKQALTMCMGFGCNAVGVTGCRIIDSPRERLLAIITNSCVPCNGRFPAMIAIITIFFAGSSAKDSLLLSLFILLAVTVTFILTYLLSKTFLKGIASSFTLEMPPYRKPLVGRILIRSLLDRTIYVLKRAIISAAPAGLIIWLIANIYIQEKSLLIYLSDFLEPFASFIGLDGVILLGFILGSPANEIVLPIILMTYLQTGYLTETESISALGNILTANGWNIKTAVCALIFILFHWPCTTTLVTIYKETHSVKWTVLSVIIQAGCGVILCAVASHVMNIFF